MRRFLAFLGLALLALLAVVLVRTASVRSRQIAVEPVEGPAVDARGAAERLAGAIRFPTVSHEGGRRVEAEAFLGLHRYLERSYPRAHAALEREVVAGYSLLYTWKGKTPGLAPVLLMSHLDVVPVEPGTERRWTQPPFAGRIADGFIWGRGALDDKVGVLAILEAIEILLGQGFQPERTVLLAFGHDEEVGGLQGAARIAALLERRGVRPEFLLDEGGAIAVGMVPGLTAPAALIGTAEKGFVSVELVARSAGGHSSMPPPYTAIGLLAGAIHRLEENPMPARIAGATRDSFEHLAPEMAFFPRMVLANLWLFGPLAEKQLAAEPASNARIRTTAAATIIQGGTKENVLPSEARAVVNFRILPGDTVEDVLRHVREHAGPGVQVRRSGPLAGDPPPESDPGAPAFALIQRTVAQVYPGTVVAPNLLAGGTDTKHYQRLTRNVYRFLPIRLTAEDMPRLHGTDERVGVDDYAGMVRFYAQLLRNAAGRPRS